MNIKTAKGTIVLLACLKHVVKDFGGLKYFVKTVILCDCSHRKALADMFLNKISLFSMRSTLCTTDCLFATYLFIHGMRNYNDSLRVKVTM